MGGTWDATNVVVPAVAVVTPIGLDHQAYLGDTIEQIAAEKAGVLKEGGFGVLPSRSSRPRRCCWSAPCRSAPPWPARGWSSACSPACSRSAASSSTCAVWPGPTTACWCRCWVRTRRTTPRSRWPRWRRSSAAGANSSTWTLCAAASSPSPHRAGSRWCAVGPRCCSTSRTTRPGRPRWRSALVEDFSFRRLVAVVGVLEDKDARGLLEVLEPVVDVVGGDAELLAPRAARRRARRAGASTCSAATGSAWRLGCRTRSTRRWRSPRRTSRWGCRCPRHRLGGDGGRGARRCSVVLPPRAGRGLTRCGPCARRCSRSRRSSSRSPSCRPSRSPMRTATAIVVGGLLVVVGCLLAAALLRTPAGYVLGSVVQVLVVLPRRRAAGHVRPGRRCSPCCGPARSSSRRRAERVVAAKAAAARERTRGRDDRPATSAG